MIDHDNPQSFKEKVLSIYLFMTRREYKKRRSRSIDNNKITKFNTKNIK